jgi:hypothetical protein
VADASLIAARMPAAEVRIAEDAAHTPSATDWASMLAWLAAGERPLHV